MAEQLQPAELSPELNARVVACARASYSHWKAGCTPEQEAKGKADHEKFKSDPEHGAKEMARVQADWTAADANADGLLDLAEFKAYQASQRAHLEANGTYSGEREGGDEETYNICNDSNPATNGVSFAEYMGIMGIFMVEMAKIGAEEAAAQ